MQYDNTASRRATYARTDAPLSTGNPFWDMMLAFGKTSSRALTSYAPQAEYGARSDRGAARQTASNVEVIPVGEETLNVGTRTVQGETTRVRRVVVETPVEQDVTLREERVVVERRKPTAATTATAAQGVLTETAAEMSDSFEVVEAWKSVRVTEEVVLRREVSERHETVRDTVRRDEVTVEQARPTLPAPRRQIETAQQPAAKADAPKAEMPEPAKAEQKPAAPQPQAEPAKAAAEQNDKGGPARKG